MEITRRHIPVSRNVHLYNKITDHLAIFKNKKHSYLRNYQTQKSIGQSETYFFISS